MTAGQGPVIGHGGWLPFRYEGGEMRLRSLCADCVWHGPEVGPQHRPRAHETFEEIAKIWFYQLAFVYGTVTLFGARRDWDFMVGVFRF